MPRGKSAKKAKADKTEKKGTKKSRIVKDLFAGNGGNENIVSPRLNRGASRGISPQAAGELSPLGDEDEQTIFGNFELRHNEEEDKWCCMERLSNDRLKRHRCFPSKDQALEHMQLSHGS